MRVSVAQYFDGRGLHKAVTPFYSIVKILHRALCQFQNTPMTLFKPRPISDSEHFDHIAYTAISVTS